MKIALASPPIPSSLKEGLASLEKYTREAAEHGARILCFPESFLPGYPGMGYLAHDQHPDRLQEARDHACRIAKENNINLIVPMDWHEDGKFLNLAFVISSTGEILGAQTKNQLDPTEDNIWSPGTNRHVFEVEGLRFGIVICHEGFRYPELVRWAARQGAQLVFHPHFAGSDTEGREIKTWGDPASPYYEKAMMMRALENTIYFASANYASRFTESASSIIAPDGRCIVHGEYGKAGITMAEIDLSLATGLLAKRWKGV